MSACNADLGHPCDADDGDPCPSCAAWERQWRDAYYAMPASVRRLETMSKGQLDQELRDAGRGHLVRP